MFFIVIANYIEAELAAILNWQVDINSAKDTAVSEYTNYKQYDLEIMRHRFNFTLRSSSFASKDIHFKRPTKP